MCGALLLEWDTCPFPSLLLRPENSYNYINMFSNFLQTIGVSFGIKTEITCKLFFSTFLSAIKLSKSKNDH